MTYRYTLLIDPYYIHHINSKKQLFENRIKDILQLQDFIINDRDILFLGELYKYIIKKKTYMIRSNRELSGCLEKADSLIKLGAKIVCLSKNPKNVRVNIIKGPHRDIYNYFLECFDKIHDTLKPIVILRIGDHLKKYQDEIFIFFKKRGYECLIITVSIYNYIHEFMICHK